MSTIGQRLAVLATLVALMAAPMVTSAAAPAAADDLASIGIATSPSGDVPVGQAMTVTVGWGLNGGNSGSGVAAGFFFRIPTGFRFNGGAPSPCVVNPLGSETEIECDYADLANAPTEFNFAVTAVRESYDATFDAAVVDPEVFDAEDSLTIDAFVPGVSADVHPLAFDEPNPLVLGQSFTLAGNAANAGTTTMNGVTTTIDLRSPLRLDGATWGVSKTPCTISGLRATCAIGPLSGHSSVPVAVSATPTAQVASTTATVTVRSTTPEQQPDPLPDTVTLTRPVKPPIADLGVAVNLPSTQPIVDAPTAASIVVTNHGTAGAAGVSLSFTTSSGEDVKLDVQTPVLWSCTQSGQKFTCVKGTFGHDPLAAGESQSIVFTVTPRTRTSGTISASVTTTSAEPAPDPTPDSATATIAAAAAASADLVVTRYGVVANLVVGTATNPTIVLTNHGPSLARNLHIVVTYPSGWSISRTTGCSVSQSTVTCDVADLPPGDATDVFGVIATPSIAGAGQRVDIAVTSSTPDPDGHHPRTSITYNVVDQPTLSVVAPVSVPEGAVAQIALDLSVRSPKTVSVTCTTGSWTATAGADFVQTTRTLTIAPGATFARLKIQTVQDSLDEPDVEAVLVACGNVVNAKPANPDPHGLQWTAFGIVDDDPLPTLVPGAVSQQEGAATTISVPITLSAPSGRTVTAPWQTEDQTAKAGSDYTATSGTVTFAPGETTKYVTVTILNDSVREPDELFLIRFTGVTNAKLGGFYGVGLVGILNDD
jgi:hypothetical protein